MTRNLRTVFALFGAAVAASAVAAVWVWGARHDDRKAAAQAVDAPDAAAKSTPREPTLYCEFYNFVGRTPKVGFYFAVRNEAAAPAYEQVFQKEIDGTQTDFGGEGRPRPAWAFDGSDSPATLRSPDDAIQINLYGYKPVTTTTWFEAGLRSVQYLNLDGKCRRSPA